MARPYREINWKRADFLIKSGCSGVQVAAELGVDKDTFYDAVKREKGICYSDYSVELMEAGEALIRAAQMAKAIGLSKEGDTQLLMWLGKVRLKQKEPDKEDDKPTVPNEDFLRLQDELIKTKYELEKLRNSING